MLTNQFDAPRKQGINVWYKILIAIFGIVLFAFVVPLLVGLLLQQGLIPSDDIFAFLFFFIAIPIIGIVAIIYVVWKS